MCSSTHLLQRLCRIACSQAMLLAVAVSGALAGTTGKLSGQVTDKISKEALPSTNILIVGTSLGGVTDVDGYYTIINIPPGKYRIQFSLVGYRTFLVQDVVVATNQTTKLDAALEESALTTETVVVTAERPVVQVNLTSTMASLTGDEIQILPVQELQDVVNLQAGVIDGHFRGGRLGEVQYQVNGVTINNPYDNSSTLRIDRSLLQEVQVISGTFDAEYGQAMSGVVNAVLRTGTEEFQGNLETYLGDYVFPSDDERGVTDEFRPATLQSYQLSVSGPMGLPKTYFLASGRWFQDNGWIYATRRFVPTDSSDFQNKVFYPTGDNTMMPLGYRREWSGLAKVSNRSLEGVEISYSALWNSIDGKNADFNFRLNPDGMAKQETKSIVHGLDWTHTLSASTFYTVSVRQNYFDYKDYMYADVYDPRYLDAGEPRGDITYELGAYVQGVSLNRFIQRTNSLVAKAGLTSQVTRDHQLKLGGEAQWSKVEFGSPGYIAYVTDPNTGISSLGIRINEPPDYPPVATNHPFSAAAYLQDQIEWNDLTLRVGARLDYFDAKATIPSDLQNPANAIQGAPESVPQATTRKVSVSPRLGVSYPVTASAAIFFSYGHFYQMPNLGDMFRNSDYSTLARLQASSPNYQVFGNPDVKPQRTIHYEFGYRHAIADFLGLSVNIFYKDIRDLLGVEFVSTYTTAEYARLTNIDYGNAYGFTISLDQRRLGIVSSTIDYTWTYAQGNSSDPNETANRAANGEDPLPRQVPFNWDQRNQLNITISLSQPQDYTVSLIGRIGSGQPYTPSTFSGFGALLEANSGRKPSFALLDLRAEKEFEFGGVGFSAFVRIFNILNSRIVNGFVFANTGSPDYSLTPVTDQVQLANPLRYYQPRRIELGIALRSSF